MTKETTLETKDAGKKPRKILMIITFITFIASLLALVNFIIAGKFPCNSCFGYPDWWTYFYPIKSLLAIISAILFWRWKKIGAYGLGVFYLIHIVSIVLFEFDFVTGVYSIIPMSVFYFLIWYDWSDYN